jgi:hypothetical protein
VTGLLYLHTPDPHTHKPTISHRDIKPSNVLLDQDKRARLADMGLARVQRPAAAHLTTATSIAGTNGYLDDYYLTTGRFDEIADAYAVGVTLLVLLSGSAAVDPVQGYLVGRCDMDDVRGSRRAGAVAQRGGSGGAQGRLGSGQSKQGAAHHAFDCPAAAGATSQCEPSSCFRARGRGGARVHDVPVGAAPRALWVRTLGTVSWLLFWAFHATGNGASPSRLQTASGAGGSDRER